MFLIFIFQYYFFFNNYGLPCVISRRVSERTSVSIARDERAYWANHPRDSLFAHKDERVSWQRALVHTHFTSRARRRLCGVGGRGEKSTNNLFRPCASGAARHITRMIRTRGEENTYSPLFLSLPLPRPASLWRRRVSVKISA